MYRIKSQKVMNSYHTLDQFAVYEFLTELFTQLNSFEFQFNGIGRILYSRP